MSLSKRNRRAVLWLIIICLAIAITPRILSSFFYANEPEVSFEKMKKVHQELKKAKAERKKENNYKRKFQYKVPKSKFDPKDYKLTDWIYLGLSPKQAVVAESFSKRGLASESDLKSIFVISEEMFDLIKDSVIYSKVESNNESIVKPEKKPVKVNLNNSTQLELESIPGIGPFFAKQIIKKREELGGFVSVDQLLEVYKIDNEKLSAIKPYLIHSSSESVRQININFATVNELKTHPYIDYNVANSIVKYREQHGKYTEIDDVKKSVLVDELLFKKIKPYINCK